MARQNFFFFFFGPLLKSLPITELGELVPDKMDSTWKEAVVTQLKYFAGLYL